MFIAALLKITKMWKQPKHLSTEEWIKKLGAHTYTMAYYSAIKRNKIVPFVEIWLCLKTVIQNEVSQKKADIVY